MKSSIRTIINIAVSTAILTVLLTRVDFSTLGQRLLSGSWPLFLVAYTLVWLTHAVQAVRWHYLTLVEYDDTPLYRYVGQLFGRKDMRARLLSLLRFHVIGNCFQLFLPSSASADVVKGYFSARRTDNKGTPLSAIVVGRVLGVTCALAIAVLAIWVVREAGTRAAVLRNPALWIASGGLAALIVVLSQLNTILRMNARSVSWLKGRRVGRVLVDTAQSLGTYRERKRLLVGGLVLSGTIQVLTILASYAVFVGLGWNVELAILTIYLPLVYLFTMLPISFNGMGVRETLLVYFLADYGCTNELVIGYAVVSYGMVITVGMVGWYLYVTGRKECHDSSPCPARQGGE